jgi:hypothetical protein
MGANPTYADSSSLSGKLPTTASSLSFGSKPQENSAFSVLKQKRDQGTFLSDFPRRHPRRNRLFVQL